jgi:C-terminal processing protease CtpA/Prc
MLARAVASRLGVWWLRSASVSHAQPATKLWFSSASVTKHDGRFTTVRALCRDRFQHLGRGLATGTGDGDAKQEQLMHHLIHQHVAAFIDEHQRDPSPDELKVIQISMHIFSTLCVGHAVQHEQPVSPEHAAVYQDYAQDSSAIAYFERESAMLVSLRAPYTHVSSSSCQINRG